MNSHLQTMYVLMYSITIKMLYKIRSIAYCTCILKGGLGTLNSWVLCHFLKAKSQSILWFRILSFVYISSLERLRYNTKKRVPRIKTIAIATPLVFSFILMIKCVSGSKKLLTIFGGSFCQNQNKNRIQNLLDLISHLFYTQIQKWNVLRYLS